MATSMTQPAIRAPKARAGRDKILLGILLAFVVLGLASLAYATGWEETLAEIAQLGWGQIAILLGLSLVNYGLRGLRWHVFASQIGIRCGLLRDMLYFLAGFAMSVTPGRLGELVRMRWINRETGLAFEKSAPLVLVDRASDLVGMGAVLAVCLAFSATGIAGGSVVAVLAVGSAIVATRPALLRLATNMAYSLIGRWPRLFARVRRAAASLDRFSNARLMSLAGLLGAVGWFAEGYAFFLLLQWMDAGVSLSLAVAIFIFSALAGGLTGAPGGIGGAEAAMIALLSIEGVPLEISVAATAVIRLTTLWFAIVVVPYSYH